ncbi:MAG: hypothetical protein M1837_003197 [Sclerophora amabilis]|nr:MAG: hypothetical protein M1837_003197 [Sclerophora amabilis]
MYTTDEDAALKAIASLDPLSGAQLAAIKEIDVQLESDGNNPFVDIQELFQLFDTLYFCDLLKSRVKISWSKRLTLCAGICELVKDDEGKYRKIRLKLSEALLKYRPREDTVDTLLHEAIHAYMFVTTSWRHSRGDDGTGHGAGFLLLADAINNHGNYHVTVFHTFHDEVDSYRAHIWQCSGPCCLIPPYFGLVKRAMNRPPGKSDTWYQRHQEDCGGEWTKIAEPNMTQDQMKKMSAKRRAGLQKNKIDTWVRSQKDVVDSDDEPPVRHESEPPELDQTEASKRKREGREVEEEEAAKSLLIACPICDQSIAETRINEHLDQVHTS